MKRYKYSASELIKSGYQIYNCVITDADLVIDNNLRIQFILKLSKGGNIFTNITMVSEFFGECELDRGYIGYADVSLNYADIMDIVNVDKFRNLVGQYVRIAATFDSREISKYGCIFAIGNILNDNWCNTESMYVEVK